MLSAEQIQQNWIDFEETIKSYISEPRRSQLLDFYSKYSERIMLMPAAHKKEYHNAFPGGYVDHVLRVVDCALKLNDIWVEMGVDASTYTKEFNDKLEFMSVPDRGLYLLNKHGISYTKNEMLAIKLHDGLYDDANKPYLMSWMPETKPRTSLIFIIHQADLMAARIEFEQEWFPKFKGNLESQKKDFTLNVNNKTTTTTKKTPTKTKALNNIKSEGLKNVMNDFFKD